MQRCRFALLAFVLCVSAPGVSVPQEGGDQRESGERDMDATHCVRVQSIEKIDIVDANTLVFRMRGDEVYRNELPHECPGLRQNDTLMYRSSVGQLCSVDIVTILDDWGFGFAPGASCGLGMFHPITEQIADELVQAGG
jgi:hypothetical protein